MIESLVLKDYFRTSDLALTSALSLWYPLEAIDKSENPHKAVFLFKRDEQLDEIVQSYWKGELKVNPMQYFQALKIIKARFYETR